jgi:hypothetical protein
MRANKDVLLGTRIDALEFGSVAVPSAGTLTSLTTLKYSTTPVIGTATRTHAAVLLVQTVTQDITTGITNPDYPRILTVKGNGSNVTGNVVITGTDINDAALTETIASSGASEVLGTKAFKTVSNINLPPYAVGGTESISIGVGNKIGFPIAVPNASTVVAKTFDGAVDSTTVTVGATAALSLAAAAGTFNGTKVYELTFLA